MKILIVGGDGMLGHQLFLHLRKSHDVSVTLRLNTMEYKKYGIYDDRNTFYNVDICDIDQVEHVLSEFKPEAVVNAIGIVKQREAATENVPSIQINSLFPHQLSLLCKKYGSRMIHMSTDCVFSGKKGNYTEDDFPDSDDLYGRSKLLGEVIDLHCVTIRTSIIGRELSRKKGLLEWFLSQKEQVKGYKKAIFSGFTTTEMSRIIERILVEYTDISGMHHISSEPISKYDLLLLIKDKMNLDTEIVTDDEFCCDRSLNSNRFRRLKGYNPPSWDKMINEINTKNEV
ncbi:MAG: SDR family oxidoreductase [Candidatus Ancaeobacter aquaticus]|nr:SDR family oxidoreductase [Candidatus Ancaeobacter aquaticus]